MKIGPVPGFAREATVIGFDINSGSMRVKLNLAKTDVIPNSQDEVDVPLMGAWIGPNGEFSGGCPVVGSNLWVTLGSGGRWAPLSYVPSEGVFANLNSSQVSGHRKNQMGALRPGRWLTQVQDNIRLIADPEDGITLGNPNQFFQADPNRCLGSFTFESLYSFTDATRKINGPVKRDLFANSDRNVSGSALTSHIYEESLDLIGLDPETAAGGSINRNPPFAEDREVVYEFANSFGFTNDGDEADRYDTEKDPSVPIKFRRRDGRADSLSLSLLEPNQLMETIKGTVVDIYGGVVDINRAILPNGLVDALSLNSTDTNKSDAFVALRKETRKSIAYHMEINARKDSNSIQDPDKSEDYSRDRSRFSIDIDKEGQFKWNVPASSEIGNISLLTRYENYSTLKAFEDSGDPLEFVRNVDNQDIFCEGFGAQSVSLTGGDDALEGFASPVDRITDQPLKLGTAYHDILQTCNLHTRIDAVTTNHPETKIPIALPNVNDQPIIVSNNIIVSGENANAGGRSGTINMDGFLSLNIGANTVDRQSVWLDCAGGIVANVGRDKNNISYAGSFDGDIFIQVGGDTISNDSRFPGDQNAARSGTVDIRVRGGSGGVAGGSMTVFRIDETGTRVSAPGEVDIVSAGALRLKSVRNNVYIDGESVFVNNRLINRRSPPETVG